MSISKPFRLALISQSYEFKNEVILRAPSSPFFSETNQKLALQEMIGDDFFREGLLLSSYSLYSRLIQVSNFEDLNKIKVPLLKYAIRTIYRCTPFGLFATISLAKWRNCPSAISLDVKKRHTRLDMSYLHELVNSILKCEQIFNSVRFFCNNSLYPFDNKFRFFEYNFSKNKRQYKLSAIKRTTEVSAVLAQAKNGATVRQLAHHLVRYGISDVEAVDFIKFLVENQVLVSELEPTAVGDDFLSYLIKRLKGLQTFQANNLTVKLEKIQLSLRNLDVLHVNKDRDYQKIEELTKELDVRHERGNLFQVDLVRETKSNFLDKKIIASLKKGLEVLFRLSHNSDNFLLKEFSRKFYERYGEQEVPLLKALDTESGIGYPARLDGDISSLLRGITFSKESSEIPSISKKDEWLFNSAQKANKFNELTVKLTNNDIGKFETSTKSLPPSFHIMFRITNFKEDEVFIESVGRNSAVNLLARFAHIDLKIKNLICSITKEEQSKNPDVIFSEVVHIPENRTANIAFHPAFREYEIPFISPSSLSDCNKISLQDLYLSVKGDYIFLRSKKLDKEIVPRLSNAHNHTLSELPVYRFLCDLQNQGISDINFDWGGFAGNFTFLPRLQYENVIFSLATWRLPRLEWARLIKESGKKRDQEILRFRKKWNLPRYVVLADGDNELFIDLTNKQIIDVWLETIKNRKEIVLKEFLFDKETPVRDQDGDRYLSQFIALATKSSTTYSRRSKPAKSFSRITRQFPPGSEWVYFKYYCGVKTADEVLIRALSPFTKSLEKQQLISKWFFIRYKDSDPHLRVRYHLKDKRHFGAFVELHQKRFNRFLISGAIWNIQMDTYSRELERYGSKSIGLVEQLFSLDSRSIVDLLSMYPSKINDEVRWLWGIKAIDDMLNYFKFSLEDKIFFTEARKNEFFEEFKISKETRLQIDKKYRQLGAKIEEIATGMIEEEYLPFFNIFKRREKDFRTIAAELTKASSSVQINEMLASFIHMHLNRLLSSFQRQQETVIYCFLYKYYKSLLARKKY